MKNFQGKVIGDRFTGIMANENGAATTIFSKWFADKCRMYAGDSVEVTITKTEKKGTMIEHKQVALSYEER